MDMYQKRKMRAENKKNDNQKSFPSVGINWYPGHMAKTKRLIKENLKLIDIVYEVIDARMPKSSKIVDIDEIIKNKPKILIFSKIDLCDMKETDKWVNYYKNLGYNVIKMNLENNTDITPLIKMTEKVMEEFNKKRENSGMLKRKIRALIIGIPNVGKSTLINRLAGKKVAGIGNKPGVTKNLNWIRVNDNIELLDTPGILWPRLEENALNLAAFTAIKEEVLPIIDVINYILKTLEKYYPNILKERYNLETVDEDIINDLEYIGKRRGCLIKGGEIDYEKAMNLILSDVKNGYIKGVTFDRCK